MNLAGQDNLLTEDKILLSISIVTFNNQDTIEEALTSIRNSTLPHEQYQVILVDNGSQDNTPRRISEEFPWVKLIISENVGFGAGHNQAIGKMIGKSRYHLVLNPDIYFSADVLEKLLVFMDRHPEAGLVMPRILYPDHRIQYLCKLLPTPLDLVGRRFIPGPIKKLFKKRFERYEMRDHDYNQSMEVPHLSGCFMLLRNEVLETIGLFDPRFFMYLEDVDYCRRILDRFHNIYYPAVSVYHHYHQGSYKRLRHLRYHIISAVKYFNKWGWFYDPQRRAINRRKNRFIQT